MSRGSARDPLESALSSFPKPLASESSSTIARDAAALSAAGAFAPLSRAYASGSGLAPKSGSLGAQASRGTAGAIASLPRGSGAGGHVRAVSRAFPSTALVLAALLQSSAQKAGVGAVPTRADAAAAAAAAGGGAVDPALAALAADLDAAGLVDAYRVVLARALSRRVAGAPGVKGPQGAPEASFKENAARFPATTRALVEGGVPGARLNMGSGGGGGADCGGSGGGGGGGKQAKVPQVKQTMSDAEMAAILAAAAAELD